MTLNLTQRQLDVLRFFRDYRNDHGLAPTLEEAASHLGVSKITIHEHVSALVRKGAIQRDRAKARAVTILIDPDDDSPAIRPHIPLVGRIAAGSPIEALEDRESIPLDELIPVNGHYLLRVRGTSMIEAHIDDGDLVLVEETNTARNGDIVVAIVDDEEATLKRFYREGKRVRLQPANEALAPTYPERLEIRGVVRGVIRTW